MRIGSLVKFTPTMYSGWGLGLILRQYDIVDREGKKTSRFLLCVDAVRREACIRFFHGGIKR